MPWAEQIKRLAATIDQIDSLAARLDVPPLAGREWYELFAHKLRPQAVGLPWLVVAVVGGTNIGKSMVFNHLVGEQASAVCPLAAGTRHPVCLVPAGMAVKAMLAQLFEGFELYRWQSPDDALTDVAEHRLYWRTGGHIPATLLVLDTPDIDSDARVNWQRADHVRQAADVLVAVLTQQKYNDAAVKQFFRLAAEADKPVVVVFNQCDLELDRDIWPQWLATFTRETGVRPERVYVAPYDRLAAQAGRLPFYSVGSAGTDPIGKPAMLRDDLAALHFDTIKLRALRGAVRRVIDPLAGAPAWLEEIRFRSREYQSALDAIQAMKRSTVDWPRLPNVLLADELHAWWDTRRAAWVRGVHSAYRWVGQKVLGGLGWIRDQALGPRIDQLEQFHQRESEAILDGVNKMLDQLERLAEVGNEILAPRLRARLGGAARQRLIDEVRMAHQQLPAVQDDYREYLRSELDELAARHGGWERLLRSMDQAAAVARPVVSVALAATGVLLPAADVLGQSVVAVVPHVAAETATTVVVAGSGEAAVGAAGEGIKLAAAQLFARLQQRYVLNRAQWLSNWLRDALLEDLLADLESGSAAQRDPRLHAAEEALHQLRLLVLSGDTAGHRPALRVDSAS